MESVFIFIFIVSGICIWAYIRESNKTIKNWETWPTVDQYMESSNPTKGNGISCYKCGSRNIWEVGFGQSNSHMRLHHCKQCKTNLYRTSRQV